MGRYRDITVSTLPNENPQHPLAAIQSVFVTGFFFVFGIMFSCLLGLFAWRHIGTICLVLPIICGFWACAYFGNSRRLFRFRRKLTNAERSTIERRLFAPHVQTRLKGNKK